MCCKAMNGEKEEEQENIIESTEQYEGESHFIASYPFINYEAEILFLLTLFINWHSMLTREINSQDDLTFSTSEFYPFVSMAAKDRFILDLTSALPPSPVLDLMIFSDIFKSLNAGQSKELIMFNIKFRYEKFLYNNSYDDFFDPYPAGTYEDYDMEDFDMTQGELFELYKNDYPLKKSMYYYTKADYYFKKVSLLELTQRSGKATVTWVGKEGR